RTIDIDGVELSPSFSSTVYDYTGIANHAVETILFDVVATEDFYDIAINGTTGATGTLSQEVALARGSNSFVITATDGTDSREYTVAIERPEPPEMTVRSSITGELDPGSTVDYGAVDVFDERTVVFTIENTGDGPLAISGISVAPNVDYTVDWFSFDDTVEANADLDFDVRYQGFTGNNTVVTATMTIETDDPTNSSFTVNLRATSTQNF
ncbi:MAG TPA: cadherin-like beta sandwich domain-containing protein, partial [Alkalispirochaeta sp.]|nr:cadherin-like beta sandwich domain-containing protein [Alkalispirochaeta sp.]